MKSKIFEETLNLNYHTFVSRVLGRKSNFLLFVHDSTLEGLKNEKVYQMFESLNVFLQNRLLKNTNADLYLYAYDVSEMRTHELFHQLKDFRINSFLFFKKSLGFKDLEIDEETDTVRDREGLSFIDTFAHSELSLELLLGFTLSRVSLSASELEVLLKIVKNTDVMPNELDINRGITKEVVVAAIRKAVNYKQRDISSTIEEDL